MKGQADVAYLLAYGFCIAIALVVLIMFWQQFSTSPSWTNAIASNQLAQNGVASANTAIFNMGNALAIVWIISAIASVVATFFIDSSPVFAVLGIIAMPIELFLSLIFHDFFFTMANNSFLAPVIAQLPILSNFFSALPVITLVMVFASIIFTFAR